MFLQSTNYDIRLIIAKVKKAFEYQKRLKLFFYNIQLQDGLNVYYPRFFRSFLRS